MCKFCVYVCVCDCVCVCLLSCVQVVKLAWVTSFLFGLPCFFESWPINKLQTRGKCPLEMCQLWSIQLPRFTLIFVMLQQRGESIPSWQEFNPTCPKQVELVTRSSLEFSVSGQFWCRWWHRWQFILFSLFRFKHNIRCSGFTIVEAIHPKKMHWNYP